MYYNNHEIQSTYGDKLHDEHERKWKHIFFNQRQCCKCEQQRYTIQ